MEYQCIRVERSNAIATVELDRKRELNALTYTLLTEIDHAFNQTLQDDPDIRLIVLTGGEDCFSAGMDLKEFGEFTPDDVARYFKLYMNIYTRLMDYEKILISAVSGIAFGGGFNLALMGDIIIASESAIFAHPEIKYGFNPLLTPLVTRTGMARSKELALRAEPIGAREACDMGLVNRVVPPERFKEEVRAWAEMLAKRSPEVVKAIKRAFDVVTRLDAKAALEYELEMTAILLNSRPEIREEVVTFLKSKDDGKHGSGT